MKIHKNDIVKVICGREKGKTGRVLKVYRDEGKLLIEKVNFVKRHQKPTQQYRQGGIIEKEAPIHISNVMYYDEKAGKASRLGAKFVDNKKKRVFKKTGEAIELKA